MVEQRSGIEMLEIILSTLERLEKKVDILDQNLKKIANSTKMAELINKTNEAWSKTNAPKIAPVANKQETEPGKMRFKFEPSDASKVANKTAPSPAKRTVTNVVVKGKMVTIAGDKTVPLPEIEVKIYDAKDKLIKETKTNRAGQWFSHLQPGKYVAEMSGIFNGQELIPQNINFEVPVGVQEFEVK